MEESSLSFSDIVKPYHRKQSLCYKRPKYREARWERAVKVSLNQKFAVVLKTIMQIFGKTFLKESQVIRTIATIGFSEYTTQKFKVSNLYLSSKYKQIYSNVLRASFPVNFICRAVTPAHIAPLSG